MYMLYVSILVYELMSHSCGRCDSKDPYPVKCLSVLIVVQCAT